MREVLAKRIKGKVLLIGVGNIMRSDDGFGPLVVRYLLGKVDADLLDAGEVPESYLGRIIDSHPDTIIILDAVSLQAEPGSFAIMDTSELTVSTCSTHRLPLALFMKYLKEQTGADVFLIGVQAGSIELGQNLTPAVQESLETLEKYLLLFLGNNPKTI